MKKMIFGLIGITFLVLAYIIFCPSVFRWKEEVLLHDGRKIIAERKDVMGGWAEPGQSGSAQQRIITFTDPDHPEKEYTHKIMGSSNYLLLDFEEGVPWLIVYVGPFSYETKCPIGTYETFTWEGDAWKSVSYLELPKTFKHPNLAVDYAPELRRRWSLLTSDQIQSLILGLKQNRAGGSGVSWRLVEKDSDGTITDCDYYRKKSREWR